MHDFNSTSVNSAQADRQEFNGTRIPAGDPRIRLEQVEPGPRAGAAECAQDGPRHRRDEPRWHEVTDSGRPRKTCANAASPSRRLTRLEVLGGVTAKLNTKWSVFAQAGYQFAPDESGPNPFRRDSFQGSGGFKYTW